MQNEGTHLPTEADIGSGEKGPAERETQEMIEQIGDKVSETRKDTGGETGKPEAERS
jgi:hypothetical protein